MAILFDDAANERYITTSTPVTAAPMTFACWGNADADASLHALSIAASANDANRFVLMQTVTTQNLLWRTVVTGPTTGQAQTSTGMTTGTWHHMCGVETLPTDRAVYIDGGSVGTNATDVTPAGADRIGLGVLAQSTLAGEWSGSLYWPAIWNIPLSASQVADLAAGYSPLTIERQALVFFARCSSIDPIDIIGNLAFTVNGTPANSADPDGMKRVAPRLRGRSRLRVA